MGLTDQAINDLTMKPMYHMADFLLDYVENIIACNEVGTFRSTHQIKIVDVKEELVRSAVDDLRN